MGVAGTESKKELGVPMMTLGTRTIDGVPGFVRDFSRSCQELLSGDGSVHYVT